MSSTPGGDSRRRLPKSKTGCRRCKKRKIKCDEGQPSCRNCLKHGVECDFIAQAKDGHASSTLTTAPRSNTGEPAEFTTVDLELLHHYTTSVCLTLSSEPLARNFWRVSIPQMGFCPGKSYILKGILSLSALHLARFKPERKDYYTTQAMLHYNAASEAASPLYSQVDSENCEPLFLFSNITLFFAFAKPRDPTDFLLARNNFAPQWLYLFRGVRAVLDAKHDILHASSIAGMFQNGMHTHQTWIARKFDNEAFRELEANLQAHVSEDSGKLEILLHTVTLLKRSFYLTYESGQSDENKVRGIFIWLFTINPDYIELVGEGDGEALCILAFFCILLRRLDFNWWIEGWGLHLMELIYTMLSVRHRLWVRWPIEEIGWVPAG